MKTVVTFVTLPTPTTKHSPEVGQIYTKTNNPTDLYIIVRIGSEFNIINLMGGISYSSHSFGNINDVFCGNDDLFTLVEKVEIILS